ncbi:MAG: hypothetical protein PF961_20370 [Planctomycetota bacterium]|jgi:hypothetical protein|nr:hypothetical protein [Planctomycetota bacterium]
MYFPSTEAEAKLQLAHLIEGCPLCEPTAECPIEKVRRMAPADREVWLAKLPADDAVKMCREHAKCWQDRIGDH